MEPANKKEPGLASAASLYSSYRSKAKKRGLEFKLSFEEFLTITQNPCYLCGRPPSQRVKSQHRNGGYIYSGIDRVDNSKGYLFQNARACCKTCNQMKSQLSVDELHLHIIEILKRLR